MIKKKDTKMILLESLKDLAKFHPLQKITIENIVSNCGYDRSVFYYHFTSKNDLINWTFLHHTDEILEEYRYLEPWGEVLGQILIFIREYNVLFCKAILLDGYDSFFESYRKYTESDYLSYIRKVINLSDQVPLNKNIVSAAKFNSYGALGYVRRWSECGMKENPLNVGYVLANSMPDNLKQYFIL
jgi:AcrR family transcriptional regulator